MPGFAICRVAKHKSRGSIAGSAKHTDREQETPNADETVENVELVSGAEGKSLLELVDAKIGDIKYRKDAVLCAEYFLGASPEYFRPDDPNRHGYYQQSKLDAWVDRTMTFLHEKHGDNLVKATLHLDEKTPHIAAFVVPIHAHPSKPGTMMLSYKRDFGGSRYTLSQLQTEYHEAVADLGLQRGAKGSKAEHRDIDEYYQAVENYREFDPASLSPDDIKALFAKAQEHDAIAAKLKAVQESLTKGHYDQLHASIRRLTSENRRIKDEQKVAAAANHQLEREMATLQQALVTEQAHRMQVEQALKEMMATDQARQFVMMTGMLLYEHQTDHIAIGNYGLSARNGVVQVVDRRDGRTLALKQDGKFVLGAATTAADLELFMQQVAQHQREVRSNGAKSQGRGQGR